MTNGPRRVGRSPNWKPAVGKDFEHLTVVRQHVRLNSDSVVPRYSSQMLQQESADPASLMFVQYRERDFRLPA